MNKSITDAIQGNLKTAIQEKFQFDDQTISGLSASGQNALTASLKQFVLKNGSAEIESILLKQKEFKGSALQTEVLKQLSAEFSSKQNLEKDKALEVADFSSSFLVESITKAFQDSAVAKNLDGICEFLGIDKNLLKMVNSPVGKVFGKFF